MSNNKQQTAVEWLIHQLQLLELNKNRISAYAYESRIHYTISKAKEMHKQETINNKTIINNNQKTAVEWYDNQLRRVFSNTTDTSTFTHEELLEQAKEMEKQEKIKFATDFFFWWYNQTSGTNTYEAVEKFHNEIYGGNQ